MREENQAIIKALNMYGRIPEQWELLKEIERLNNIIKEVIEYIHMNHKHFGIDERDYIDVTGVFKILDKEKQNENI